MEACRCSIVPTICHLTPRLLATVLGPLKKARDHYPSRPYRPRALAPRWQSGKWHSGFIARMTFHLLKDDWGGRRQLTRQIEKIFRCRTSTPRYPPAPARIVPSAQRTMEVGLTPRPQGSRHRGEDLAAGRDRNREKISLQDLYPRPYPAEATGLRRKDDGIELTMATPDEKILTPGPTPPPHDIPTLSIRGPGRSR
jgi:hypothetical protein